MERKLCECGCGEPTSIIRFSDAKTGRVKGEYSRFVKGHAARMRRPDTGLDEDAPLCACGCGQPVDRIGMTNKARGRIKGEWNQYIRGHRPEVHRHVDEKRSPFDIDPETGCWNWNGPVNKKTGYGYVNVGNRQYGIHRLAWQIANGIPLNDRLQIVRHTCDNRRCMNPAHLVLGSHQDNTNDAKERDRMPKGESHANAKLDDQQVRWVREWHAMGRDVRTIALRLRVSKHTVRDVIDGETWSHVV